MMNSCKLVEMLFKQLMVLNVISLMLCFNLSFAAGAVGVGGQTAGTSMQSNSQPESFSVGGVNFNPSDQVGNKNQVSSDPNYAKCGPDCLYKKANENISLQIVYARNKLHYIQDSNNPDDQRRKLLGAFCPADEETDDCAQRYGDFESFWELKIRTALLKNSKSSADLSCSSRDSDGNCSTGVQVQSISVGPTQDNENDKLAQVTTLLKAKELYPKANKTSVLGAIDINIQNENWDGFLNDQYKPSKDDFVKFQSVPKDSDNPEKGNVLVPITKTDGSLEYDLEAFKQAEAAWGIVHAQAISDLKGTSKLMDASKKEKAEFINGFGPNGPLKSVSVQIYNNARGVIIDKANEMQGIAPAQAQSVPVPNPSPSSSPNGTSANINRDVAKAQRDYTGDEVVKAPRVSDKNTSLYNIIYDPTHIKGVKLKDDPTVNDPSSTHSLLQEYDLDSP